jgi:hypothetical protein
MRASIITGALLGETFTRSHAAHCFPPYGSSAKQQGNKVKWWQGRSP